MENYQKLEKVGEGAYHLEHPGSRHDPETFALAIEHHLFSG